MDKVEITLIKSLVVDEITRLENKQECNSKNIISYIQNQELINKYNKILEKLS